MHEDIAEYKKVVIELLQDFKGPDNCILMAEIFVRITGSHIIPNRRTDQTRMVRTIIKELREEGHPIGIKAGSSGGYFIARTDEELKKTIEIFHNRAISSLKQEAALKRIGFNELLEQYEFELTEQQSDKQEKAA